MKNLVINDQITIPAEEMHIAFARSGGPGGQNVNKVESKVELRWVPSTSNALRHADREWLLKRLQGRLTSSGELLVTSTKTRDQSKNRADALSKMALIIRGALERPKVRKPTRPSRAGVERRLEHKRQRAARKQSRKSPHVDD